MEDVKEVEEEVQAHKAVAHWEDNNGMSHRYKIHGEFHKDESVAEKMAKNKMKEMKDEDKLNNLEIELEPLYE